LASLAVNEWLIYVPIFIDFNRIESLVASLEKKVEPDVFRETVSKIKDMKIEAWISPDFTTKIDSLGAKLGDANIEIDLSFRLRTLCLEIYCWGALDNTISVSKALEKIWNTEKGIRTFIKHWDSSACFSDFLVVSPFRDDGTKPHEWLTAHLKDLEFFPTNCGISTFTVTSSKLIEKTENLPFLLTEIRDNTGLQRKVILLCAGKVPNIGKSTTPLSFSRVRWFFFTGLIQHVLDRMNESASSIAEKLSLIDREILKRSHELPEESSSKLMEALKSIVEKSKEVSSLENEFLLLGDDLVSIERNLWIIEMTMKKKNVPTTPEEEMICGNVEYVSSPKSINSYGIFKGRAEEEARNKLIECDYSYNCIKCKSKNRTLDLTIKSNLEMGIVQETNTLIKLSIGGFLEKKSEIERCMARTKSFISAILSNLSTQVNLSLDLSISKTAMDQREILDKMEKVLEEGEKDRKATEKATKAVETLSLLFASFVLGEISSNFIIMAMQQAWGVQVPAFAYIAGFFLALGIAGAIFSVIYFGYLKRKWR